MTGIANGDDGNGGGSAGGRKVLETVGVTGAIEVWLFPTQHC